MRLHLVDGTYELFRAYFSKRPSHLTPQGWDAKATLGVVSSLFALIETERASHLAVAFDNPIRSFRNELFEGYKSDEGVPEDLRSQFDVVEEAVRAMGVCVWSMREHEADDALATGAARFADQVEQVRIYTPDKDLGQCVRGTKVVQVDRRAERVIDEAAVRAQRGVGPESIPDLLALTGDTADGIPGLAGFGEKSASTLLAEYVHLENIPAHVHEWKVRPRGALKLADELQRHREEALLYRKLATLVTDVPLRESLDELRFEGVPRRAYEAFCDKLGVTTLKTRPSRWRED